MSAHQPPENLAAVPPLVDDTARYPTVSDLLAAHRGPSARFTRAREAFEEDHGVTIVEEYYAKHVEAAAVLLRSRGKKPSSSIRFHYCGGTDVRIDATMGKLYTLNLVSSTLLDRWYQEIASNRAYVEIVTLMNILDGCRHPDSAQDPDTKARLKAGLAAATVDFEQARRFILDLRRRMTLRTYLLGFPVGAVVAAGLAALGSLLPVADTDFIVRGLLLGAVGAIVSAMVRITRGQALFVDIHEGRLVTWAAGAFRPLIGAVFGVVIYVLTVGGLLPFVSAPADPDTRVFFFMGLAFIAGFSERWAQDTIIQSAPRMPSSMREAVPPGDRAPDVTQRGEP